MDYYEWLASLKPGDTVIKASVYGDSIGTITRETATQIVVGDERYHKKGGHFIGQCSGYSRPRLAMPTEDRVDRAKQKTIADSLRRQDWLSLSLDKLTRIKAIINEDRP